MKVVVEMFTGTLANWYKKAAFITLLVLISILCSIIVARNYETGLVYVFWVILIACMTAYLIKNLSNHEKMLCFFLFTIPLMNILPFSYKYVLPLGGTILIFLTEVLFYKKIRLKNILTTKNGILLVFYVVLNVMLFPYSVDKKTSATYMVSFPFILLLWDWVIQYLNSKDKIIHIFKTLNFIGVFYSILGFLILALNYLGVSVALHLSYTKVRMYDVSSVFPNTNTHGVLLSFIIPCAFYLFLESRKNRLFYLTCCFIMGINLILTFSRSSWGAAFIAVMIMLVYKFKNYKIVKVALSMGALLTVYFMIKYVSGFVIYIMENPERLNTSMFTLSGRGILWNAALKAIVEKPLTGFGIGNSVAAISNYSIHIMNRTPHNTFLRMWVEMGVFGLLTYLLFLVNIIYDFFKTRNKSMLLITIFAVIAGTLFLQMFETMLLGGLSIIGGYFFIFSALFESLKKIEGKAGDECDENMLSC